MEPSCFGFNKATSISCIKPEVSKAPETNVRRKKEKQRCLEDDPMQEIEGTSLLTKVSRPQPWANRILPSQIRPTQLLPLLPTHFVNIDERVSKVLLQLESNQFVGIIGVGGSGKTTLTKAVLHHVHQSYEATSFVTNMKGSKVVLDIQKQLLQDLKCKNFIPNIEVASKCLQNIFEKKKVFVVFDDVTSQQQLHAIVPPTWVFANGSKMIATSRDWQNLKATRVSHNKMEMEIFNKDQAKELFYKHASSQKQSQWLQFEEVANEVIEACYGLPLSLEVLGSYLCGVQQVQIWEHALQRLGRGPCVGGPWPDNERIWTTLKISYDNLNEEEKSMFLDIACFFCCDVLKEGMPKEKALKIWNDDGGTTHLAFLNLMDRSLVQIGNDGMLTMHDHLRDMGRMVACNEYLGGQRIWSLHYELEQALQSNCTVIPNVGGLHIDGFHCKDYTINSMWNFTNLRLLNIDNCGEMHSLYKAMKDASMLRWMRISILDHKRNQKIEKLQPLFFVPFKQLRALEMNGFIHLRHLPHELNSLHMLEYVTISNSQMLQDIPDTFGYLTSLITLNLSNCENLREVPHTFGNLTSLVTLDLSGCMNLYRLPNTLGNLKSLITFNLSNCEKLKILPRTLGNLSSLVTLVLSGCKNLCSVPDTLDNLSSLVMLDLSGCTNLRRFRPNTLYELSSLFVLNPLNCKNQGQLQHILCNLTSLVTLDLSGCKRLYQLPYTLGTLSSLVTLELSGCKNLHGLPNTLGNLCSLITLNLSNCENLEEVQETLGNLTSLVTLDLSGCKNLHRLPDTLGNLSSLITLNLCNCKKLEEVPQTFGKLTSLGMLDLSVCKNLYRLPDTLGNLTSLTTLNLSNCENLEEIPWTLSNLTSLVTFDLCGCKNFHGLPNILGNLSLLVTLKLSNCEKLEEVLETLRNLTSLVTLELSCCKNLYRLPNTLGNLSSLTTLNLSNCENLEEVHETLGNLTSLVTLDLSGCKCLYIVPYTLGNLSSLVTLELSGCKNLDRLPDTLGNLSSLVKLDLCNCENLSEVLQTLGTLTSLVMLDLSGCKNLYTLPNTLGNLASLTIFNLCNCENLEEIPQTFGNLTSLVTFDFHGCKNLHGLPDTLGNLSSLITLNLSNCEKLEEVPETLGNLTSLVTLELSGCKNLDRLPVTLGNLSSLMTLNLSNCENLREVPHILGNLTSLVTLDLSGCKHLYILPGTLGNLSSLITLNLCNCEKLEHLPETLGNLMSLVTLGLSGCKNLHGLPDTLGDLSSLITLSNCEKLEIIPQTLDNLTSSVILGLHCCEDPKGKGLQRLVTVQSDLIAAQESQSGTNFDAALSSVTTERADEDQKIFSHILGQREDAIDQSQAQNNSPSIPCDRKEDTNALEGPKSQEPLDLQPIICSKGDGVALDMKSLKSNLEDHGSFATTVVGEMVDDSLRLCFENGETMSRMVGVGLDHAVVTVSCDYEILVEEKAEDVWRSIVSDNETTRIERLMVRISNLADSLDGDSSQPLNPIRMAKLVGVGIEGPGIYTNREKKPSVSRNAIIELVKTMFWTRFQSRVHGAKIWDLERENEDGPKDFKVPPSWWSTKWWQNIAVDDIQLNAPFSFNEESSSGKIGRQQSADDNAQRGKDPSSSDEDSKLQDQPFDKIKSHGKRKSKHGGDNNGEDDDHNNPKRTCQDGSKVELYVDEEDDIISTVCVSVKPKYGCWKPPDADLDKEPAHITPHLKFWFHKFTSSREIKVNTSVMFDLGDHGPTRTSGRTFFGWFHDDIEVSLQSMEHDSSTLKHDNMILQPSASGKISLRETSGCTSNPAHVSAHLPVVNRPFNMGGILSWEKGRSATHTREFEQICEMVNQQSWSGFIFKENCCGGARPRLAYNLKHPYPIPNQVWEKPCYDLLVQCGICSTVTPAIEGTWEDLNESEASPYLLEAKRVFQKRCKNKMISTRGNEPEDDITVKEQKYHVTLYVNHAMTHMTQFQRLRPAQNKPMEGGLINLQDDFYGKVGHGKLCQEQVA